ncbi:hypothetical protein [Nioella nitratireducens]|uniref:hypothetical protein n=1 Tax=Nioella nitratireducens TaxID=1287720 RepID=UPI000AC157B4|nr:hypothetical protein [Nioella nitratireducens]
MRRHIMRLAMAATLTLSGQVPLATPASAYQVDCAILLCLAGGWPASAPCAHARAVFIRRITPWPIEPPLQIWRCPMGTSYAPLEVPGARERLFDATFRVAPPRQSFPSGAPVIEAQANEQADIDISGDAFGFVRSIRVFHILYGQRENQEGECNQTDSTRLGSYGVQGDYRWTSSNAGLVPPSSQLSIPNTCRSYSYRSVFVDWRDHAGNYGSEEVRY